MRKTIHLCSRIPGIDHARYDEILRTSHIPIALKHHPALRRYVVNVVEQAPLPPPRELDSVGELSFESMADWESRLYDSPQGKEIVQRDVATFLGAADQYECSEIVHRSPHRAGPLIDRAPRRSPGVKLVLLLWRKPEMSHEEFVRYWVDRHAPIVLEHGTHLSGYIQNVVDRRLSTRGEPYDGIAELHYASEQDFATQLASHGQSPNPVQEDTANFVGGMHVLRLAEYVAKLP